MPRARGGMVPVDPNNNSVLLGASSKKRLVVGGTTTARTAITSSSTGNSSTRATTTSFFVVSILLAWIVLNFALVEWVLSPEGRGEQQEERDSVDQRIGGGIPASSSSAALLKQRNARKTSSFVQKQSKPKNRPPLDAILSKDDGKVIGDPGFLLDVAVIGFGKCGTSTIMDWMGQHREVRAFPQEVWNLMDRQLSTFIERLYTELEPGPFLYGYKAPQDITQDYILDYYRKYWPNAKLIIGIRHPVLWFQSFYNFRIQTVMKANIDSFPAPEQLIGNPLCSREVKGSRRTCTSKGDFAFELLRLGKQNYPVPREASPLEKEIVDKYRPDRNMDVKAVKYMPNPVFLFEVDQLADKDEARNLQFRQDVTDFMGLSETLGPIPHNQPGSQVEHDPAEQLLRDRKKINICEAQHDGLRQSLMKLARHTSLWIRQSGFLDVPTVFCSSREHLEDILLRWMEDPCSSRGVNNG